MTAASIIAGYVFGIFFLLRLFVPHLGFRKEPLPEALPADIAETIRKLNAESADDLDFLKRAFSVVTSFYRGGRLETLIHVRSAFENPLTHKHGYMACTGQNFVLRVLLVKSGRFSEADVTPHTTMVNFFIHQYLRVLVGGKWIEVDPWGASLGVPFGERAGFFT